MNNDQHACIVYTFIHHHFQCSIQNTKDCIQQQKSQLLISHESSYSTRENERFLIARSNIIISFSLSLSHSKDFIRYANGEQKREERTPKRFTWIHKCMTVRKKSHLLRFEEDNLAEDQC